MQSYNITEGLEAESYTWKKANPAYPSGNATSEVETQTFTGTLEFLKNTLAPQLLATGDETKQVAVSITRRGGGMAEMSVTSTFYMPSGGGGGGGGGGSGGGTPPASSVGSSAENPVYDFQITEKNISILLHPKVLDAHIDMSSAQGIALKMLSNGSDRNATFSTGTAAEPVVHTVGEALESVDQDIITLVERQSFFLSPGLVLTVRWQIDGEAEPPTVGDFFRIAQPEGGIGTPKDRNWLLAGGGTTIEGDRVVMSKKYILSDAGGWDESIYGS